jgi:SAM-dependent methyltransferase
MKPDLVISAWVLEHLAHPAPVFRDIARVLKPDGHFIFITPNARSVLTRLNRAVPQRAQARLVRGLYGRAEQDGGLCLTPRNGAFGLVYSSSSTGTVEVCVET